MISKRTFLTQSSAAAALSISASQPQKEISDVIVPCGSKKKGLGMSLKNAAWAERLTELLGLNEPDVKKQGNMSIEETLDAWPVLMDTGMRLGSPGCVHPDKEWMIEFMAGAGKRNLRVDFICVHSYGSPSAEGLVKRWRKSPHARAHPWLHARSAAHARQAGVR